MGRVECRVLGDRFGEKRGLVGRVECRVLGNRFGEKRGLVGRVQTACWVTGLVRRGDWWVECRQSVG